MITDAQVINFFRSVQYGKNLVKDVTPEMISSLDTKTTDKIESNNFCLNGTKKHICSKEKALRTPSFYPTK